MYISADGCVHGVAWKLPARQRQRIEVAGEDLGWAGRAGWDGWAGRDWGRAAPRLRSLNRMPLTILVGAAIKRFGFHAIAYFGVSQNPDRVVGVFAQILDGDVLIC